jgi:hypothetical protein
MQVTFTLYDETGEGISTAPVSIPELSGLQLLIETLQANNPDCVRIVVDVAL